MSQTSMMHVITIHRISSVKNLSNDDAFIMRHLYYKSFILSVSVNHHAVMVDYVLP